MAEPEDKRKEVEGLTRALELELLSKRVTWEREREKYRRIRTLFFSLLSLLILGALALCFFAWTRMQEAREQRQNAPATSKSR